MKQAQILIDDIKRMKQAMAKSKSYKLRKDYTKAISRKTKELIDYCNYKGLEFDSVNYTVREKDKDKIWLI